MKDHTNKIPADTCIKQSESGVNIHSETCISKSETCIYTHSESCMNQSENYIGLYSESYMTQSDTCIYFFIQIPTLTNRKNAVKRLWRFPIISCRYLNDFFFSDSTTPSPTQQLTHSLTHSLDHIHTLTQPTNHSLTQPLMHWRVKCKPSIEITFSHGRKVSV